MFVICIILKVGSDCPWLCGLQLKNIGRKYKKQAEDVQKETDALKKQYEETLKVRSRSTRPADDNLFTFSPHWTIA